MNTYKTPPDDIQNDPAWVVARRLWWSQHSAAFFRAEVIPPPGQFVAVRDWLVTLKRPKWPIWRLRLAADLLCELQAQGKDGTSFRGKVVCTEGATMADLKARSPARPSWGVGFRVVYQAAQWWWSPASAYCHRDMEMQRLWDVRARVLAAFQARWFDTMTLAHLLAPTCLVCGKALTDPLSMARLIGPDCAATASQAGVILWDVAGEQTGLWQVSARQAYRVEVSR